MIPIDMMTAVKQLVNVAEQGVAASYEYSQVETCLDELVAAVNAAIRQDREEANSYWTEMARALKHLTNYFSERARFNAQADAVVSETQDNLSRVLMLVRSKVGKAAPVPGNLESDAAAWSERRGRVDAMSQRAAKLRQVAGWKGQAYEQYVAAATVQQNALQELSGIMESTAQGCKAGAMLNRAIFFVVGKAIKKTTSTIRGAAGGGGSAYYVRTSTARYALAQLVGDVQQAVTGSVAAGSADSLADQMHNTVAMPNLLSPGQWPTGTSAVGTTPANTGDGVTSEGNDTNLAGNNAGGQCVAGVNL